MIFSTQEIMRQLAQSPPALQFLLIAVSSAFTEEVAVIGVLGLARMGQVSWLLAVTAIVIGTTVLNVGLYLGGRFAGHKALQWKVFRRFRENGTLDTLHKHVDKEGWLAVAISRFVPGTRVPVFLLSGILDMEWHKFVSAILVSTVLWMLAMLGLFQVVMEMAGSQPLALGAFVLAAGLWVVYRLRGKATKQPR